MSCSSSAAIGTRISCRFVGHSGCGEAGGYTAPCINAIFGPTVSDGYWSSSTYQNDPGDAWYVGFYYGYVS